MSNRIKVVCRKRPLNRKELAARQQDVVQCADSAVQVREPKLKVDLTRYIDEHMFQFDETFDESVTNEGLYRSCVHPLVQSFVYSKAKCTCFAYGQTGSGKTFTMLGESDPENSVHGVFPLAMLDLFELLKNHPEKDVTTVVVSFYEIYCGKLYDLLNGRKHLHARENAHGNVVIQGIRELHAESPESLMEQIQVGLSARTTGVTGANVDSSRSHAIIQISMRTRSPGGKLLPNQGKLSFIDLAGSERGADTVDQDKQTRIDGAEINKSLLALKECIRALDQQLDHTPFRGSKLTQVLKDSFIGQNCMTLMIANISPSSGSVEHTLNTLRYAYRVKELRGSIVVRRQPFPSQSPDTTLNRTGNNRQQIQASPGEDASSSSNNSSASAESTPRPVRPPVVSALSLSPLRSVDLDVLAKEHDRLIGTILAEEEDLIATHRKALEVFVQMLNEEMAQVNLIDQPGSDVDMYVSYMDENLRQKEEMVKSMRSKLDRFKHHLMEEERMSLQFEAKGGVESGEGIGS